MKNTQLFTIVLSATVMLSLAGCGNTSAEESEVSQIVIQVTAGDQAPAEDGGQAVFSEAAEVQFDTAETDNSASGPGRQDGERFETVIILEGMEETVRYEHIRNDAIGVEMDYDYESFIRHSESERECFVSIWDNPQNPENYLEVTYSAEDADAVAASVSEEFSKSYDIITEMRTLDCAGDCIRIEASELKGTGRMADQLQAVYIIPASDGCRVATAHYSIEGAEGFGRRFSYMMNTLAVIDRNG